MLYRADFLARTEASLRRSLSQWGIDPSAELALLDVSENATFRVSDPATGRVLVLRVHRPGYHTSVEIRSELAWIEALRSEGIVETLRPVPAASGTLLCTIQDGDQPRHVVASEFLPGHAPTPGADLETWFERLGAVTARLHAHSRRWRRPSWFQRKSWTAETILGAAPHWGHWRAAIGLEPQGAALLSRTQQSLERQLQAYGMTAARFGLIHADLRLTNLLVDAEVLRVIDFDDCGFGWFGSDFAAAISFIEHEPYIPSLKAAWLYGYRQLAPFAPDDERALDTLVMLRRLQLTAWVASHAETPTAQQLGPAYTEGTIALAADYLDAH